MELPESRAEVAQLLLQAALLVVLRRGLGSDGPAARHLAEIDGTQ